MSGQDGEWPDDLIDRLKLLWGDGLSASKIGAQIGKTRSAVIGKAHRLGLAARENPIKRRMHGYVAAPRTPRAAPPKVERKEPVAPAGLTHAKPAAIKRPTVPAVDKMAGQYTLNEVSAANTCRWPFGDRDFTFCGAERENQENPVAPYCAVHRQRSAGRAA